MYACMKLLGFPLYGFLNLTLLFTSLKYCYILVMTKSFKYVLVTVLRSSTSYCLSTT